MRRLSKLSARFIGEHGFSIGVDDVTPAQRLLLEKQATIDSSYLDCQVGSLDPQNSKPTAALPYGARCRIAVNFLAA